MNDQYGHCMGDVLLQSLPRPTSSNLREQEFICAYGAVKAFVVDARKEAHH